eukprot:Hpha_TRINITY_DN15317_c0_g15::TRINITY_DN15317_c0_g15_i1::g.89549::m.89549
MVVTGLSATVVVIIVLGVLLFGLLFYHFHDKFENPVPPPLCHFRVEDLVTSCKGMADLLFNTSEDQSYVTELAQRAVFPPDEGAQGGEGGEECVQRYARRVLSQPWVDSLAGAQRGLPAVCRLAVRMYSQDPQDIDREMGWEDAPPPGRDSGGHGMEIKEDCAREWREYKERMQTELGREARNQSHYRGPSAGCIKLAWELSAQGLKNWRMHLGALHWATSTTSTDVGANMLEHQLVRVFGNLPKSVQKSYAAVKKGHSLALLAPTSASKNELADGQFMGAHPGTAVVLQMHFPSGFAQGLDLSEISMYPGEAEVLLPMWGLFKVTYTYTERRLGKVVYLPPTEKGASWGEWLKGKWPYLRCMVRPIRVIELEWLGCLHERSAGHKETLDGLGKSIALDSSTLLPEGSPRAPAGVINPLHNGIPPRAAARPVPLNAPQGWRLIIVLLVVLLIVLLVVLRSEVHLDPPSVPRDAGSVLGEDFIDQDVWASHSFTHAAVSLYIGQDEDEALKVAARVLKAYQSVVKDQWDFRDTMTTYGSGGAWDPAAPPTPSVNSHYARQTIWWAIPLALSGQRYDRAAGVISLILPPSLLQTEGDGAPFPVLLPEGSAVARMAPDGCLELSGTSGELPLPPSVEFKWKPRVGGAGGFVALRRANSSQGVGRLLQGQHTRLCPRSN